MHLLSQLEQVYYRSATQQNSVTEGLEISKGAEGRMPVMDVGA